MPAYEFVVRGRVQGVGFRYFTYNTARDLGLLGFVQNCNDGTVQGHAQGDESTLKRFFQALQSGPALSRVDDLQITPCNETEWSEFSVERNP